MEIYIPYNNWHRLAVLCLIVLSTVHIVRIVFALHLRIIIIIYYGKNKHDTVNVVCIIYLVDTLYLNFVENFLVVMCAPVAGK